MKFYIGDKVRMLDGCKVLCKNPKSDFVSSNAGNGAIFTVKGIVKYSDGRIGISIGENVTCDYDKRGLELVKRGPHAPKRHKKKDKAKKPTEEKTTPRFKIGDMVRVKMKLVPDERYDDISCTGAMARTGGHIGAVKETFFDTYYSIAGQPFIYSKSMLEPVTEAEETTEKPKEGKTLERMELIKTFMKLTETDKPLKKLTDGIPLIIPTVMIILNNIEKELLGEE